MRPTCQVQPSGEMTDIRKTLSEVKDAVLEVKTAVSTSSLTAAQLPKIEKPIRGVDYNRTINPVTWLRSKIDVHNAANPNETYVQFHSANDHRIAVEAKVIIGRLLREKLGRIFGRVTWTKACSMRNSATKCEEVVRAAHGIEELRPFTYSFDAWAIRMLCDSKMKSAMRAVAIKKKRDAEVLKSGQTNQIQSRTLADEQANEDRNSGTVGFQDRIGQIDEGDNSENTMPDPRTNEIHHEAMSDENADTADIQERNPRIAGSRKRTAFQVHDTIAVDARRHSAAARKTGRVPQHRSERIVSKSRDCKSGAQEIDDDTPLSRFAVRTGSFLEELSHERLAAVQDRNPFQKSQLANSSMRVREHYRAPMPTPQRRPPTRMNKRKKARKGGIGR